MPTGLEELEYMSEEELARIVAQVLRKGKRLEAEGEKDPDADVFG
jgi:hypothetical protein